MRLATLRRSRPTALPGITGVARVDRRTKNLTSRLKPGDIAVIDHVDIDRVSAEGLVAAGVVAVVNAAPSISGRYPNLGPEILLRAGVAVLDNVGSELLSTVQDGRPVRLDGAELHTGGTVLHGERMTADLVAAQMLEARAGLAVQLEAFAANTMEYLRRERDLLLDGVGVPRIRTRVAGRHALIVVRGYNHREDIASLRPYIREYRPVLIAVDGGADALVQAGYQPDIIVGDLDSASSEVLSSGAEVVVHAYPDGRAPGLERAESLGLDCVTFPAAGTSEDVAMLLADELGASLIVAVGSHATLEEFLDKGRAGMASTFITRLRVGGKLVDAKGVSRLYRSRIRTSSLMLLVAATMITLTAAFAVSPGGFTLLQTYGGLVSDKWQDFLFWVRGVLPLMVDFRYHLVSIIAVFLALGVGIVLGTTTLNQVVVEDLNRRATGLAGDKRGLQGQVEQLEDRLKRDEAFDKVVEPRLIAGQLAGRRTTVVAAPGVSRDTRDALVAVLRQAGAQVVGQVRLLERLSDPQAAAELDGIVTDNVPPGVELPSTGPIARAMTELAAVLAIRSTPPGSPTPAPDATQVLAGLQEGRFLAVDGPRPGLASVVVVLAPAPASGPGEDAERSGATADAVVALTGALGRRAAATLAACPRDGAQDGGAVSLVRSDEELKSLVATVDGVDTPEGRVAAVLTLAAGLRGEVGHYGHGPGSDGPAPSPHPARAPVGERNSAGRSVTTAARSRARRSVGPC